MSTLQQYLGRFYVGSDRDNFSIGGNAVSLINGYYYICGYSGEATHQFCEHMQAQIRAHYPSATVTYSASTGKITIATGGAAADISWTDSALQTMLGFTGSQTGQTSYTATNQVRYVWRPSLGLASYPTDLSRWWAPSSTTVVTVAPTGATASVAGTMLYTGHYSYMLLDESEVITSSSTVWESFQQFWTDVAHAGQPIRCYWDRTRSSASDIATAIMIGDRELLGDFSRFTRLHIRSYQGLWNVEFDLAKEVS